MGSRKKKASETQWRGNKKRRGSFETTDSLSLSIVKIEEKKTKKKREKNRGLLKNSSADFFLFTVFYVCCRRIVTSSSRSFSLPHEIKEKQKGEVITKNEKATEQNHF